LREQKLSGGAKAERLTLLPELCGYFFNYSVDVGKVAYLSEVIAPRRSQQSAKQAWRNRPCSRATVVENIRHLRAEQRRLMDSFLKGLLDEPNGPEDTQNSRGYWFVAEVCAARCFLLGRYGDAAESGGTCRAR
jgi:hypothetical protein